MKKGLLKKYLFPLLLVLVSVVLFTVNYEPNTYLSGWDTLHPEFNFSLAWDRALSVWQNFQGLGSTPSQAQATELVRIPILWLLSLMVPLSMVRYLFMFFTWLVGVLGMYVFVQEVLGKKDFKSKGASFIASLFYLLNLATVQQYFVPLSMFAVHFAGLPWLLFFAGKYLKSGGKKKLLVYSLLSLLFSPMAHTPTLFYVYLMSLVLFGVGFLWKKRMIGLKRLITLVGVTVLMNAYWLLPNMYYLVNHGMEVSGSSIHQNFSDEARLQSQLYGTTFDLSTLKNFLFNWRGYDFDSQEYVPLMGDWVDHVNNPVVTKINIGLFVLSLLGLFIMLVSGSSYGLGLGLIFLMGVFFWMNNNPPFGPIYSWLQGNIEVFKEGFRFPFTKFSLVMVFAMSTFLGRSIDWIVSKLKRNIFSWVIIGFAGLIFVSSKPAFEGWFISPLMKVDVPQEYFDTFEWLNAQPDGRVLKLPMQSMYGWNFYDWGYQGAGFTWFGINKPTLDREFDRWNSLNEIAYTELVGAYFNNNWNEFEGLLDKYRISYVFYDKSVVLPGLDEKVLLEDRFVNWQENTSKLGLEYFSGDLSVYSYNFLEDVKGVGGEELPFSKLKTNGEVDIYYQDGSLVVSTNIQGMKNKILLLDEYIDKNMEISAEKLLDGSYLVSMSLSSPGVYLNDDRVLKEKKLRLVEGVKDSEFVVINGKAFDLREIEFSDRRVMGYVKVDNQVDFGVGNGADFGDGKTHVVLTDSKIITISDDLSTNNRVRLLNDDYELKIVFPVENYYQSFSNLLEYENNCSFSGEGEIGGREYFRGFGLTAKNGGVNCTGLILDQGMDYLVAVNGENISGRSLKMYVTDIETGFSIYEWVFDSGEFNQGFVVNKNEDDTWLGVESRSYGRIESENILDNLILLPVNIDWINGIRIYTKNEQTEKLVEIYTNNTAYEKGFIGFLDGKMLEHVKVNGWANGFVIPGGENMENRQVVIVFWPQYLEWGGLLLLVLTPVYILVRKRRNRSFN